VTETSPNSESNAEPFPRRKSQDKAASEEVDYSFHPLQFPYEDGELFDAASEQKMHEFLRTIEHETSELSVSLTEEGKLIREICISLTQILKKLDVSIDIPTKGLPVDKNTKKIILNKDGNLQLLNENDEKQSAPLSEYPPEILMAIVWRVMPELVRIMTSYKDHVGKRLRFFEGVKKELRTIANTIARNKNEKTTSAAGQETEDTAEQRLENETQENE
jgi:hypothetical protein